MSKIPTISIVDDDDSVREATQGLVRSLGYKAFTFSSAEDFLESEHVHDSSCLITDLRMPGMSGVELQNQLIADGHQMPIIFITAHPEDDVRARVMKAGAVCFMSKPYNDSLLIDCLDRALKHS